MMKKVFNTIFIFLFFGFNIQGQTIMSVDDAIKIALEKNYAIQIVKNNQAITKAQNNFGNAGMAPTISLNAALSTANLNSHQEFNTGAVQDRVGAQNNNLGASINANWVVFDGLKMFAIKKRLNLNEELSSIQLKQQMENTIVDVVTAYYDVVRISSLINSSKQNLSIYEERKKIAQLKFDIGSDSKVDLLLTQLEFNKAKSLLLQLELQLQNAKTKLNTLLSQTVDTDFKTADTIVVNYNPSLSELKKNMLNSNSSILVSKQMESISQQNIKEVKSANLPFIQLNAAYNFTRAHSQAGFLYLSQQYGLNGGITASWLLFNGNKNNKLIKERNLQYLNQRYVSEQIKLQVDADVFNSYQSFILNKQIVDLETKNLTDSKEVLDVSIERYKIGKTNLLETIETQKILEDSQNRHIQALYNAKISETILLKLNGALLK